MPGKRAGGAIDQLGRGSSVVRGLLVLLLLVVLVFTVSTLPGVRSTPGFDHLLDGWLKNGGYVLAAGLVLARAIWVPASRLAWALIAAAMVARAFGFVAHWLWVREADPVRYPSIADAGWLLSGVLLLGGVVALTRSSSTRRGASILLDATVGVLAAGALATALLYATLLELRAPGTPVEAIVTNLAYPALDMGLLIASIGAMAAFGWRPPTAVWWLVVGIGGIAIADGVFVYLVTEGLWRPGSMFSALSLVPTGVIAAAAWVRPRQHGLARSDLPDLVAPAMFAMVCLGVLVYATQRSVPSAAVVLATMGLVGTVGRAVISFRAVRSVAQLHQALEQAEVGQYQADVATGDHRWPTLVAGMLGLADGGLDPGGVAFRERIPAKDREWVWRDEQRATSAGSLDVTHRLENVEGDVHIVRRRAHARYDADGQLVGWDGTIQDLTDQHRRSVERLELLRRSVASADDERQRLAEHLHDEVVQLLAAAVLRLDLVDGPDERIDQVFQPIAEATRLLRTTISELARPDLHPGSLATAIDDHATRLLEPDGITVEIDSDLAAVTEISPEMLVAAYRIVQEALSNVRRHAQATRVRVEVHEKDGQLLGRITDDGVGIDQDRIDDALARPGHLGLRLMRERAEAVGGGVEFRQPGSGSGTEVRWWLPIADTDDLTVGSP